MSPLADRYWKVNTGLKNLSDAVETVPTAVLAHEQGLGWNTMMTGPPQAQPDRPPTATLGDLEQKYGNGNTHPM
jgi:hypothetical protein